MRILLTSVCAFFLLEKSTHAEGFLWTPLEKLTITCDFCGYKYPSGNCHGGLDLRAKTSIGVFVAASGKVEEVVENFPDYPLQSAGYGNKVVILHPNGYRTIYGHLAKQSVKVEKGGEVTVGQQIASSDNSGRSKGSHLHFEVRNPQGKLVDPYDDPNDQKGCLPEVSFIAHTCGPNALWVTCPPEPYKAPEPPKVVDADNDGVPKDKDCNDNDPGISPEAKEPCDGVDNNCNGVIDDPWNKGVATDLGKPCVTDVTGCDSYGKWICAPNGAGEVCDAVLIQPSPEVCDGDDNDCNGVIDDLWPQLNTACEKGTGTCKTYGTWQCADNGKGAICNAYYPNKPDCTGKVCGPDGCGGSCGACPEGLACNLLTGACPCTAKCAGKECGDDGCGGSCGACQNGKWCDLLTGICECGESIEVCDGKDNDCDGETDECDYLPALPPCAGDICDVCTTAAWNDHQYIFCDSYVSRNFAKDKCAKYGHSLLSIGSDAELAFVSTVAYAFTWISLTHDNGYWKWGIDVEDPAYSAWCPNEPVNNYYDEYPNGNSECGNIAYPSETCAVLAPNALGIDKGCVEDTPCISCEFYFMCEKVPD